MQTYRDKLVDQITHAAITLKAQADNLVDWMDMHTDSIIITIEINDQCVPTITVKQSHIAYLPSREDRA